MFANLAIVVFGAFRSNTVKALINARAFIRIVTFLLFTERGMGVYKRLECSQSII